MGRTAPGRRYESGPVGTLSRKEDASFMGEGGKGGHVAYVISDATGVAGQRVELSTSGLSPRPAQAALALESGRQSGVPDRRRMSGP